MNKETWLLKYCRKVRKETEADVGYTGLGVGDSGDETSEMYAEDRAAAELLNDLKNYPHAYVLGCLMDVQIPLDRAWRIPYRIQQKLKGDFSIDTLCRKSLKWYRDTFNELGLHRFNNTKAEVFYLAVHKIKDQYGGDASKIWKGCPRSSTAFARFSEFKGAGIKVSAMAVDLLRRCFGIDFRGKGGDLPPDRRVIRVFKRYGLVDKNAAPEDVLERARELNPEYPGIFDEACFTVGGEYCKARNPYCEDCPLESHCPKLIETPKKAPAHTKH
jgi:endonuclease III